MGKSKDVISGNQADDTVARLYALRAGLSVISERADEIREIQDDLDSRHQQVKYASSGLDRHKEKIADAKKDVEKIEEEIEKTQKSVASKVNELHEKPKRRYNKTRISYNWEPKHYAYVIIGNLFALDCLGVLIAGLFMPDFGGAGAIAGVTVVFVICALFGIVPIVTGYNSAKKAKAEIQQEIENENAEIQELKIKLKKAQDKVLDLESETDRIKTQNSDMAKEILQFVDEKKIEIKAIVEQVSVYHNAMETEFTSLLNPADWHNTDLCIFYLQTGRADSIKECLLLADRQRQNDEIVGAIRAAGERISSEIRNGFKALGSTMVACINALSMQIETMGNSLAAQNDELINQLSAVENSNTALLSATQLNNALQAKANQTSEQLLRDYRYVQNCGGIAI